MNRRQVIETLERTLQAGNYVEGLADPAAWQQRLLDAFSANLLAHEQTLISHRDRPTISIDLDGTLHSYELGWHDGTCYGTPFPNAEAALWALSRNFRLVISTCREDIDDIWRWLREHNLSKYIDLVTNEKPIAAVYIDDRAIKFEGDWEATLRAVYAEMGMPFEQVFDVRRVS